MSAPLLPGYPFAAISEGVAICGKGDIMGCPVFGAPIVSFAEEFARFIVE